MEKDSLRQRVADRLKFLGIGPVEAAGKVPKLGRDFIRDLIEGKKESFNQAKAPLVAEALGWTVAELLGETTAPATRLERGRAKISYVPLLDRVTAGKLKSPSSQIPIDDVPLLAFADLGQGEWFALQIEEDSDSMDRVSPPNSIIVVNRADRTLINGKYYVFSVRGETTYKMWQGDDHPHLAPFSWNPANKPIFFKRKSDLEVIGRVKRTILDL